MTRPEFPALALAACSQEFSIIRRPPMANHMVPTEWLPDGTINPQTQERWPFRHERARGSAELSSPRVAGQVSQKADKSFAQRINLCCRQLEKTHSAPDRNDTRGGSGSSVEPPKQRSAAPAEAITSRLLTPDPLRQQRARSRQFSSARAFPKLRLRCRISGKGNREHISGKWLPVRSSRADRPAVV